MTDLDGFLNAIKAEPADDGLWLVFADWLEERFDPAASEVRMVVETGGWDHYRNRPLRTLEDCQSQKVASECLLRV
jgi:uncharacterized protein (TIGR02996 family)